jgi:hypothetical protein
LAVRRQAKQHLQPSGGVRWPLSSLKQIAAQDNAKRPEDKKIHRSAHVLRHTIVQLTDEKKKNATEELF